MKKIMIIPVAAVAIGVALLLGAKTVSAQTGKPDFHQALVQKIAQKFGLNQNDVQQVFDEHHAEMKTQMRTQMDAKVEASLTKDVTDGKITEAQKQIILAKYKELADKKQTEFQNMKGMTPEQRKAAMETEKQELLDWAKQNNLDVNYLMSKVRQVGFHHMMNMKWKK